MIFDRENKQKSEIEKPLINYISYATKLKETKECIFTFEQIVIFVITGTHS